MKCPDCESGKQVGFWDRDDGRGGMEGGFGAMTCFRCGGSGEVEDRVAEWIRIGAKCKEIRLARLETLRKFATRTGVNASMISRWECGWEDPSGHPDFEQAKENSND